jgi:hypothetical protein
LLFHNAGCFIPYMVSPSLDKVVFDEFVTVSLDKQ